MDFGETSNGYGHEKVEDDEKVKQNWETSKTRRHRKEFKSSGTTYRYLSKLGFYPKNTTFV